MTATWDEPADRVTDQWRDERLLYLLATPWWLSREAAASVRLDRDETVSIGAPLLCEGCGQPCSFADYAMYDGHGPDCPSSDPDCQLRVCDGVHADPTSHSVCETQAERDGRDAVEAAEAGRERWAEWHAEDGL